MFYDDDILQYLQFRTRRYKKLDLKDRACEAELIQDRICDNHVNSLACFGKHLHQK